MKIMDYQKETPKEVSKKDEYSFFYRYCLIGKKKYEKILRYFIQTLRDNSFDIKEFEDGDELIFLLCQTDAKKLLQQAEANKVRKIYTNRDTPSYSDLTLNSKIIENEKKSNFTYREKDYFVPDSIYDELYTNKKSDENWGLGIFTESDLASLQDSYMSMIKLDETKLLSLINETPLEKKVDDLKNFIKNESSFFYTLSRFKVIKEYFPLHISDFKENIFKKTVLSARSPYRTIRSYFGDKVAIYYAWMYHYTRFLAIPAVTALLIVLANSFFPDSSKLFYSLYALIIAIWAQLFIVYWDRKCQELSIEWDNFTEQYDNENQRREFKGEWKRSPITEQLERQYSNKKRMVSYFISLLISLPCLLLAILVNISFLNLSGFIKPKLNSILEFPFLAQFSEPGRMFEIGGIPNKMIGIIQVITILFINKLYRRVAEKTTDWENHRVKSNHENSLILKRFIFEFFDSFMSVFYLAFVAHDMVAVKSTIKGLFIANEIRRVLTETVIPNIIKFFSGNSAVQKLFSKGNKNLMKFGTEIQLKDVLEQKNSAEYEIFDDYLEIVLEFGFLVLFAECFPLAPIFILIVNNIEIRSDIFKLSTVFRRPLIIRKRNIGSWHLIFKILATMSVFTNMLFTFTFSDNSLNTYMVYDGMLDGQLLKFFLLEHAVFLIILFIRVLISSVPQWVDIFLKRREYKKIADKKKSVFSKTSFFKKISNKVSGEEKD